MYVGEVPKHTCTSRHLQISYRSNNDLFQICRYACMPLCKKTICMVLVFN